MSESSLSRAHATNAGSLTDCQAALGGRPARLGETTALNDCRVNPSDVSSEYATQCLHVPPTCTPHIERAI